MRVDFGVEAFVARQGQQIATRQGEGHPRRAEVTSPGGGRGKGNGELAQLEKACGFHPSSQRPRSPQTHQRTRATPLYHNARLLATLPLPPSVDPSLNPSTYFSLPLRSPPK